jgi:hypothetical protein
MSTLVGNWVAESCSTVGTGDLIITGEATGQASFRSAMSAGNVFYSILDGANREAGIGAFNGSNRLVRSNIGATLVNGVYAKVSPVPISLTGNAIVSCTYNASAYEDVIANALAAAASASASAVSAAEALASQNLADADATATAADVVTTNADVVLTNADVATTAGYEAATSADAAATALDKIATNADVVLTNDDAVSTGADVTSTNADAVSSGTSATTAQLRAWDAEAEALTADSYATQLEDVLVNSYASDGDGTFTATPTTSYSALHYAAKVAAGLIAGTGVTGSYTASVAVGGTTLNLSAVSGEINGDQGIFSIAYAGATGTAVANLSASSSYVYIDNAGNLQQQATTPTRQDWTRNIYTMRIAVDTATNLILGFEYLNNPIGNYANSTRDLYTFLIAQGVPFKRGQVITGRATDLGFDTSDGDFMEFGGTGDIYNPNIRDVAAVSNTSYTLTSRTAFVSTETNLVKFWDNAGTITPLGSTTVVAHRVYRFSNGNFAIQYGQGNYANMTLAKAGALIEEYVLNPALKNATFFGWWFIEETATNTGGTTLTEFKEYTIGIQGGSSSGLAGCLLKGNNLSDLLDAAAARANLGVSVASQATVNTGTNDTETVTPLKLNNAVTTAKAWVNFNGVGVVAIRSSFNVSSITDNGTGDYEINFATNMADVNYAGSANTLDPLFANTVLGTYINNTSVSSAQFTAEGSNGTRYDKSGFYAAIFGNV